MALLSISSAEILRSYPAVWLRENCPCSHCRDPRSGQNLGNIADLPADLSAELVDESPDTVTIRFSPDGHASTFNRSWLVEQLERQPGDGRTEADNRLWTAADLAGRHPGAQWSIYTTDPVVKLRRARRRRAAGVRDPAWHSDR